MAVKHVPTGVVHRGNRTGKTGCGIDTNENPDDWLTTVERITCDKEGCDQAKRRANFTRKKA